jgi:hypothetical protein
MRVALLKVLLFVAILTISANSRLLTENQDVPEGGTDPQKTENVENPVVEENNNPVVDNAGGEKEAPEDKKVEANLEKEDPKNDNQEQKNESTPQTPAPGKKNRVGLFILVGVVLLGVVAIGTTFVLGKQKN